MAEKSDGKASHRITSFLLQSYRTEFGVHTETVIGAAAALAGEFALRSSEPNLPDSGWILSHSTNCLIFENEKDGKAAMWSYIRQGAEHAGAKPDDLPDPVDVVTRTVDSLGQSPYPPLTVPAEHYPHEWSPNACPRLRGEIEKIGREAGLSLEQIALSLARSIVILINEAKDILSPAVAATLALEIMIGVARMPPLKQEVHEPE